MRSRFQSLAAFFLFAALLALTAACGGPGSAGSGTVEQPRAVILMIGDGLGPSQITFARDKKLQQGERFAFERLPVVGLVSTYSESNKVTDSGAAATAFASGVKTTNQVIGVDPEENPVPSIADRAKENGWKVGLVTNTELTHATPAGFYANVTDRYEFADLIAEQMIEKAPDVALGGGRNLFLPRSAAGSEREDEKDLLAAAEAAGYTLWGYDADLDAEPPAKLLGLFGGTHLPFVLDARRLPEGVRPPSLAQLTRVALRALSRDGEPFFLMVEGGRIDHAAHDFDALGVASQVEYFDEAVAEVLRFQKEHPETLVLLTADHATGGLSINDYIDWDEIDRQQASLSWIIADIRDEDEPQGVDYLNRMTGYDDFTEEDVVKLRDEGDKYDARRNLGRLLGERQGVTWIPWVNIDDTKGHTGEDVPIFAGGPGAERFGGVLDNTEIPQRICELLGWQPLGG